jgi:hypothetical protein
MGERSTKCKLTLRMLTLSYIGHMQWITREHPKIDRLACPWLIKRFIDQAAEILYVPADQVLPTAARTGAIPFDVPNVEFSHYGSDCTFDYFLKKYALDDPALHAMAPIIRGADTDHHALAPQAAGLWAISAGLAYNVHDDQQLLQYGLVLYDACRGSRTPNRLKSNYLCRYTLPTWNAANSAVHLLQLGRRSYVN